MRTGNFVLEGDGKIRYLIAGGNNPASLYLAVMRACDDVELFRNTGVDTETYTERFFDARAYIGQTLYLKAVDNFTGGWGHLNLDNIRVPVSDQLDGVLPTNTGSGCTGSSSSAVTSSVRTSSSSSRSSNTSSSSSRTSSSLSSSSHSVATSSATSSRTGSSSSTSSVVNLRVYDFESGGLENWTVTGDAFSAADISTTTTFWDNQPFNQQGTRHLWSFQSGGDDQVGTITTPAFILGGDGQIRFKLSGGNNIAQLYLALVRVSDGAELLKVTGNNSEAYADITMNAAAYLGENLKIRLVDNATGGFGHINLDYLRIPTNPTVAIQTYNFESGNLQGWTQVGDAFSAGDVTSDACYWVECFSFNREGNFHLWGYKVGGDAQTGELRSPVFRLAGNGKITLLLGGGNNVDLLYVGLVDSVTGAVLVKITGNDSEALSARILDGSAYLGRSVYLRVMDNSTGGFGHLNLDNVQVPVAL
jgi:hypothetical protein